MKFSIMIAAMTIAISISAGIATAETVDIGMGQMDRGEFEALKQMVSGDQPFSADMAQEKNAGVYVAEFEWSDVQDIRQAMNTSGTLRNSMDAVSDTGPVDIGTGAMSAGEFCGLNNMVPSNTVGRNAAGFQFICQ
jgi:hypothetical protein